MEMRPNCCLQRRHQLMKAAHLYGLMAYAFHCRASFHLKFTGFIRNVAGACHVQQVR